MVRGEREEDGRLLYAAINPKPIEDGRLLVAMVIFLVGMLISVGVMARIYGWLLKARLAKSDDFFDDTLLTDSPRAV